jgi:hypothetical protein
MNAPLLPIADDGGSRYSVKRVGYLTPRVGESLTGYLETTGRELYRTPAELGAWVYDAVALALRFGSPFPAYVEFNRLSDGRISADIE